MSCAAGQPRLKRTTTGPRSACLTNALAGERIGVFVEPEQLDELGAGAAETALDRADLDFADRRRLLVGQAVGANQDQHLALLQRQPGERAAKILEVEVALLVAGDDE